MRRALEVNADVVASSDVLLLAVKPQSMTALMAEIRPALLPRHLIISIAAGITLRQLAAGLGAERRIIRVMPNTPCLVGASASAFAAGEAATDADVVLVERLLNAVGRAFRLPESLLDAVTGLSGSGPAFVYVIIEALSDGGVRMGLPRDVATVLAAQTVLGSAKMVLERDAPPGGVEGHGGEPRQAPPSPASMPWNVAAYALPSWMPFRRRQCARASWRRDR